MPLLVAGVAVSLLVLLLLSVLFFYTLKMGHIHLHSIQVFLSLLVRDSSLPFPLFVTVLILLTAPGTMKLSRPQAGINECLAFYLLPCGFLPFIQGLHWHRILLQDFQMDLPVQSLFELEVLPPRQAAKLSHYGCDPSWFCSPHDVCFIHELCLCEGSSRWPPVKLVRSSWVSESCEWLAAILSHWQWPPPPS